MESPEGADAETVTISTTGPTLITLDWTNINELGFSSSGGTNAGYISEGTQFALDNLTVDISETPLPAALPLFATGLGALALLGWRRKRTARRIGD